MSRDGKPLLEQARIRYAEDTCRALEAREEIETTAMGMFAAVVNEFANGNITHRPWGAILSTLALLEVLQIGLVNVAYLTMRSYKRGVDQKPICRAFSYLILVAGSVSMPARMSAGGAATTIVSAQNYGFLWLFRHGSAASSPYPFIYHKGG
jgi:hypothetical protein